MSKVDKATGALAGLAIGDALGRPVEGLSLEQIENLYGEITEFFDEDIQGTDDTEFAILTSLSLVENGLNSTSNDFAKNWIAKIIPQQESLIGAGFSELNTVRNLTQGIRPPFSGMHSASWSDGLAMRVAPIGIAAHRDYGLVNKLVISDGQVSNSGEGIYGGQVVATAVATAFNDESMEDFFQEISKHISADTWMYRNLSAVRDIARDRGSKSDQQLRQELTDAVVVSDYPFPEMAPEAVALAIATILIKGFDFENALLFAVNIGRDTDTIAAICGAVIGARVGYQSMPQKWISQLKPAVGSCLNFTAGINLIELAPALCDLSETI